MHQLDPLEDIIALSEDRWQQVPNAMNVIAEEGRGVVVLLRDMAPNLISARLDEDADAPKQLRQYGIGAQILASLGVTEMVLLSNSPTPSVVGLDAYGLSIVGSRKIREA